MKILLVLPAIDRYRVHASEKVSNRKMLRFSILPLTMVAALTPDKHQVCICDENVEALDLNADVQLVGISFMTALAPRAYEIASAFRKRGIPVVAGGYHPTFCPQEAAAYCDSVVIGEAENAWPALLADVENNKLQKYYRGGPADLSRLPVPRRDLIGKNAHRYVTTNAVQTGRGCPHTCRYCSITAFFEHAHRQRPIPQVINELRMIPRYFMFVDDNIISDRTYAASLFKAMIPLKKRWVSQCDLKIADDPELLDLAYQAGCRGLFIGIETANAANLASVNKEFNDSGSYKQRVGRIRHCGIAIQAGVIVGLDHDDTGVFERTLSWLDELGIDAIQLNILTPLPGTPLYDDFRKAGRITDYDLSHYDFRHAVIRPARMSQAELQEGADWLYAQYYRLDRVLWRAAKTFFSVGPLAGITLLRLNMTYRYDNIREGIVGRNPAFNIHPAAKALCPA